MSGVVKQSWSSVGRVLLSKHDNRGFISWIIKITEFHNQWIDLYFEQDILGHN